MVEFRDNVSGLYKGLIYCSSLNEANQNKTNLEYRLRQLDASRITFINSLKSEVEESGISPAEE